MSAMTVFINDSAKICREKNKIILEQLDTTRGGGIDREFSLSKMSIHLSSVDRMVKEMSSDLYIKDVATDRGINGLLKPDLARLAKEIEFLKEALKVAEKAIPERAQAALFAAYSNENTLETIIALTETNATRINTTEEDN